MSEDQAKDQARAQYENICELVEALNCDYDRLDELKELAPACGQVVDGRDFAKDLAEWTSSDEGKELTELQQAAGDCENQDAARDRIQEDPLSVLVRSGWYSPGDERDPEPPEDFEILLCTGGPAVRIMGELDEASQPDRAWLEYQCWGVPWTRYFDTDQEVLLRYATEFYFGG